MLATLGHTVELAGDGPAALQRARAETPDIMFSDISMPGMNGYELAGRFRADPNLKDIVLVAITGFGQPEDRDRALEAGFDHHLVKPADFDALQSLFATVASSHPISKNGRPKLPHAE